MVVSPQRLTRWPSYVRDRHAAITYTTPRDAPRDRPPQDAVDRTAGARARADHTECAHPRRVVPAGLVSLFRHVEFCPGLRDRQVQLYR
ncbi:hypothetical protein DKM27_20900 [Mycobacterium tuberculosis variant bovis]|nr:hypothetical protein DKM27_20900 [Mycobacterium tuberculosis variant bovis]